jgi:microcystin-dependent protein
LLPINQNQALFSLLGTTYGGNGSTNFALPDLRGQVPIHVGNGHTLGERAGSDFVTLNIQQLPAHLHLLQGSPGPQPTFNAHTGSSVNATEGSPTGNYWANSGKLVYSTSPPDAAMSPATVTNVGGSQPHENRSPYLALNFCIALQGIFPSPN